jgi:branched-chain amino acid transport system permease protein
VEFLVISLINGISYGLLLFMLSAGLTLIFSMMGILNFAHASFYMLGAYIAYSISLKFGFWTGLIFAPLAVGSLGAVVERYGLRLLHRKGSITELLFTFGLAAVISELVQLIWGRSAVPYRSPLILDGPLFSLYGVLFPAYRGFMILIAAAMLIAIYTTITRSRFGLIIRAAMTHPQMVEALGHNVPRILTLVFAGGCGLAGLAGVIGGAAFVTDPSMAGAVGSIIFVVIVVGGMGSLKGAFVASLLIGLLQTIAVGLDYSLVDLLQLAGLSLNAAQVSDALNNVTIAQIAPVLPYLLLIVMLLLKPRGLFGTRL